MARKPTQRKQVDPRDTYRYSTQKLEVNARPTDPYVTPADAGYRAGEVAKALDSIHSTVKSYSTLAEHMKKVDHKKALGVFGKDPAAEAPEGESKWFYEKWSELKGGHAARTEFRSAVAELVDQSKSEQWEHDEWLEAYGRLSQEYLKGKDEAFIRGFIPKASQVEESAWSAHTQDLQERFRVEHSEQIASETADFVEDTFLHSSMADWGKKIRSYTDGLFPTAQKFGLTKNEVSSEVLKQVGQLAILKGEPELLSYGWLKGPGGVAVSDTALQAELMRYKKAAETARTAHQTRRAKEASDKKKEDDRAYTNDVTRRFLELNPREKDYTFNATMLWTELAESGTRLPENRAFAIQQRLQQVMQGDTFRTTSSRSIVKTLNGLTHEGVLEWETLTAYSDDLSEADYKMFSKAIEAQENEENAQAKEVYSDYSAIYRKTINNWFYRLDPVSKLLVPLGTNSNENARRAQEQFLDKILEWRQTNDFKYPPAEKLKEFFGDVKDTNEELVMTLQKLQEDQDALEKLKEASSDKKKEEAAKRKVHKYGRGPDNKVVRLEKED
nr:hypothetical protein 10 [Deltaproteobacteria bacterium]